MLENISFTKMHGIGNDYIYINCFSHEINDPNGLAKILSNRNFSIGGDGIILILKSDVADFRMRIFNADGSEAKMCGNGIRCVAKFVYEKKMTSKDQITIETKSGIKFLKLFIEDETVKTVKVDMGEPDIDAKKIPVKSIIDHVINQKILPEIFELSITYVSMGNPHAVIFVDEITDDLVQKIGPQIEKHALFRDGINVEFVRIINKMELEMRVWERGSNETLACGTGACAAAVAAIINKLAERDLTVKLRGGDLKINWDINNHVYMQGAAQISFEGNVKVKW